MRFILINGPARVGKDTGANVLVKRIPGVVRLGFADHLKRATHAAYGIWDVPFNHFEDRKDKPCEEFFDLSPRRAYIEHSQGYMKVVHGPHVFGHIFLREAKALNARTIVVPDSGFAEEAQTLITEVGAKNVLLIRVHQDGRDFFGDSRSYIELDNVATYDLQNKVGAQDAYEMDLFTTAIKWLYLKQ